MRLKKEIKYIKLDAGEYATLHQKSGVGIFGVRFPNFFLSSFSLCFFRL